MLQSGFRRSRPLSWQVGSFLRINPVHDQLPEGIVLCCNVPIILTDPLLQC